MFAEAVVSALVLTGAAFALIGSIGLAKLPDFFTRLHGPTKATTLGVGSIVIASLVHMSVMSGNLSLRELVISLFLFITAPISAHVLSKCARAAIGNRTLDQASTDRGNPLGTESSSSDNGLQNHQ